MYDMAANQTLANPLQAMMQGMQYAQAMRKAQQEQQEYQRQQETRQGLAKFFTQGSPAIAGTPERQGLQALGNPIDMALSSLQQQPQRPNAPMMSAQNPPAMLARQNQNNPLSQLANYTIPATAGTPAVAPSADWISMAGYSGSRGDVEGAKNYASIAAALGKEAETYSAPVKGLKNWILPSNRGKMLDTGEPFYSEEKPQKAPLTWSVKNGRVETTYGFDDNGKKVVIGQSNMDAPEKPTQAKAPREQIISDASGSYVVNLDTKQITPIMKADGTQLIKPTSTATTEGERNAAGFYNRMLESTKLLGQLEKTGKGTAATSTASRIPLIGGIAERSIMSDDQQKYKNAAMAWIRAKLRKESGAAIGNDEAAQEYATYFPMVGDGADVIKQKAQLRDVANQEMSLSAGALSKKVNDMQGGAGNTNAKGWVLHTDKNGNKAYVSPDGKQYEEVK